MHDLKPITALGGVTPRKDVVAEVTLTERPDIALASVAARVGQEKRCQAHLKKLIGAIPGPGQAQLHDPESGFWTGPDQWLVSAPFDTHENIADQLKSRFGETASITEQTDAWVCFDLRGSGVEDVIELLCNVNIRNMRTGDAQRTSIHHLGCFVIRCDPADWLRIIGPRASAGSLHHALLTAMTSAL